MPLHPDAPRHPRVLIAAFEGWSDAGAATTTVLQHLGELIDAEMLHAIGADGFVDFQVHRPKVTFTDTGARTLDWPETRVYGTVQRPGRPADPGDGSVSVHRIDGTRVQDLFLLAGVEPARDWTGYAEEIIDVVDAFGIDTVILLGSLFSDAPHSRPIQVTISSDDPQVRQSTGASRSTYEGPVGIATVLDLSLTDAGIPVLSLWAQVPHYVHSVPSPKATLAILDTLEELLDVVIPRGELLKEATEWESNIDRIAAADEDMARYIRSLEEARDATIAPEATGEAIAHEFEKFLSIDERPQPPAPEGSTPATGDDAGTASDDDGLDDDHPDDQR